MLAEECIEQKCYLSKCQCNQFLLVKGEMISTDNRTELAGTGKGSRRES